MELTNSGALDLPGRIARDLASAYENWLGNSSIPESAITQVSARTLARIGKADRSIRLEIETHLKQESKFTENDLTNFLSKPAPIKGNIGELIKQAKLSVENMKEEEKLERFPKLFIENIQLKKTLEN